MIQAYMDYWKRSFNYTANVSMKEFLSAFIFNLFILAMILLVGVFVPITWENVVMDFWYIVMALMIIPTISLVIRIIRKILQR
ncbi:hypothetical protein ACTXLQ_13490 [Enterococcus hirae]|uniref:hypothetical protein n=1 Tax=Enterococcus TaxID=1350 RepID=UPI001376A85F|nr:hypothetical protein [Enterococcus hirae]EMF0152772.1 hypothetical protein [Enterococcus hirae]EMF0396342.1 hypothetical protein [Enterococcus hirae]EMF0514834.1 hypothetical protein [Enterococcus hirae]EMF0533674.1 hypothetical protein [Enterococcus hirae]MCO5511124.1 hypothetical protein [Enterococcus hirae]